jgi:hypothetical protein
MARGTQRQNKRPEQNAQAFFVALPSKKSSGSAGDFLAI